MLDARSARIELKDPIAMKNLTPSQEAVLALRTALDEIERLHKYIPPTAPLPPIDVPLMIRNALIRLDNTHASAKDTFIVSKTHSDGQKVYLAPSNFWVQDRSLAAKLSPDVAERHARRLRATVEPTHEHPDQP